MCVSPLPSAAVLYIIHELWYQTSQIHFAISQALQDDLQQCCTTWMRAMAWNFRNSCCKMDHSFFVNRKRADSTHLPCNSTCSSFIANSYEASSLPGIELHHSYWLATKLRPLSLLHCHLQTPLSDTTTPVITPSYPAHVLFPGNNVFTQADHWQGQNMKRSDSE